MMSLMYLKLNFKHNNSVFCYSLSECKHNQCSTLLSSCSVVHFTPSSVCLAVMRLDRYGYSHAAYILIQSWL